jgi:hypothetical protein
MPRKPNTKPKPDDPAEYARFLETAKQVEANEDDGAFERALKRVVFPRVPRKDGQKEHS